MPESTSPKLVAVVLAAGCSRRFGSPKQLATVDAVPMVRRAVTQVGPAQPDAIVLVAGHEAAAVHAAAAADFLVINERYAEGMGTSIACAARTLCPVADAMLLCLADQPLIPASHFAALREAWGGHGDRVVATAFGGTHGPPVVFGKQFLEPLLALSGETGAKALLESAGDALITVRCDKAGIDIDRPGDLDSLDQLP